MCEFAFLIFIETEQIFSYLFIDHLETASVQWTASLMSQEVMKMSLNVLHLSYFISYLNAVLITA